MSLRHPGYIYGVRPYGNSLEYRAFFGLPNQRHFSKRISVEEINRLNIIESMLNKQDAKRTSDLKILFGDFKEEEKDYYKVIAIDEYLRKTKDRFKPFRQYHYVTSSNNIIANNIVVNGHDLINTVTVHYKNSKEDNKDQEIESIELSSLKYMDQSNRKEIVVRDPNIVRLRNAFRWGLSTLINKTKLLYLIYFPY